MNEINFTYSRTNFINNQSYNERTHAEAWEYGLPNFVTEGLELNKSAKTISAGQGINRGVPFGLGVSGETQALSLTYNYIYVKSVLNGYSSLTTIVETDEEQTNTASVKWFKIYDMLTDDDLRHSSYVKEVYFESAGTDKFIFVINGQKTPPFDVSILQSSYSKSEQDNRFERMINANASYSNADFNGKNAAVIFAMFNDAIDTFGSSVITGRATTTNLPALKTAIDNLLTLLFGESFSSPVSFRLESGRGKNYFGTRTLSIMYDGGIKVYNIVYDDFGTNYLTENSDAFRVASQAFEELDLREKINISRSSSSMDAILNIDLVGTGNSDFPEVIRPIQVSWLNGTRAAQVSFTEILVAATRKIYLTANAFDGSISDGIRAGGNAAIYDYDQGKYVAYAAAVLSAEVTSLETRLMLLEYTQGNEALAKGDSVEIKNAKAQLVAKQEELQEQLYLDEITSVEDSIKEIQSQSFVMAKSSRQVPTEMELKLESLQEQQKEIKARYGKE